MEMAQSSVDSDRLSSAGISTHSSGTAGTVGGSVVGVRPGDPRLKREDEDEYNLGPLPPMWEKAFTPSGEVYFIDHNTGTSHWLDPRLARVRKHSLGECGEDELPFGWERVTDERYGSYYVDHINRRTQYENPVLQARRLRAEKLAAENTPNRQSNGGSPMGGTNELRGERFSVILTKGTQGLGFTLIPTEGIPEIEGYLQIRSIVPHSPAWMHGGLRPGDVLVGIGDRGTRGLAHAQVAQLFQSIPPHATVHAHLVRGYPLPFDSEDPNTRVLSTLAVDATTNPSSDAVAMQQLTRALRTRFNLESPNHAEANTGHDEPDTSPSSNQRRLMSRSFDLDELTTTGTSVPPRCPSADHLLSQPSEHESRSNNLTEAGRELVVSLRRGAAGFGFTVADSVHGQKVKKVLDRSRCAGLREGDLLLQIGEHDVRHAPHQHVVQVLKECPALSETTLRVWRRNPISRAPRSRSATRAPVTNGLSNNNQLCRSKTPTAEQLRNPTMSPQPDIRDRLNGMDSVEATYAVISHKKRESLIERRRNAATLALRPHTDHWDGTNNGNEWHQNDNQWNDNNNWENLPTPTVHLDLGAAHSTSNNDHSNDNGGFPEDGMLHSPTTAAISGLTRQSPSSNRMRPHSPSNSTGRLRSHSPSTASATDRLLSTSPTRMQSQSPSNSSNSRLKGSPMRLRETSPPRHMLSPSSRSPSCFENETVNPHSAAYYTNYPQVEAGGTVDPEADVLVRLALGSAGFGFRIVGGTEDGSRVAVGHVVPRGPADGLLRPGDLLTSVDGIPLAGATHARAVAYVCQAAARGHVTLGVRHNRADIQSLGMSANMPHQHHQPLLTAEPHAANYNILHPAPVYPPANHMPMYGGGFNTGGNWRVPYDVTVTRGESEGFGFVVISSTNKATTAIGQLIPNSPAARCGLLHVGDTILAINGAPIRNLPHPEVVALIKRSGTSVTLTVAPDQ